MFDGFLSAANFVAFKAVIVPTGEADFRQWLMEYYSSLECID